MDFSFFTTDNKSGYKTTEKWLSQNHNELYNSIIEYSTKIPFELNFKEKILFYFRELTERPNCITCSNEIKFRNRFDKPYGEFCSLKCINENKTEMLTRQKKTFNEKYGINFYPEHKDFLIKRDKTKKDRYGDINYNNLEKSKKTKMVRYGDENFVNVEKAKNTCIKKYGSDNYSKSKFFQNQISNTFRLLYPDINILEINDRDLIILCNECKEQYNITKQLLYERYKRGYKCCTHCNPIGNTSRSGHESEISKILENLNIEHECSNRKIISKELDIYIPNSNLAIEINGVYWHNELFVSSKYHLEKTNKCNDKNIHLIHLFEDEWLYKKDIVLSIIKNSLKLNKQMIYARKCVIKEVSSNTSKEFLEKNHIQGNVNSKIRIGLFYNNEMVSLMTFSKGRIIMGGKKDEWELTRFCNLLDTNVIGAANKLFQYFLKTYHPEKVISYSDIRLFKGEMYEKLGFTKISQSKPNYWYVINGMRYHRFNFRKSILLKQGYDKDKTERDIMFDRKIYRIYDCGNIKWEFNQ